MKNGIKLESLSMKEKRNFCISKKKTFENLTLETKLINFVDNNNCFVFKHKSQNQRFYFPKHMHVVRNRQKIKAVLFSLKCVLK